MEQDADRAVTGRVRVSCAPAPMPALSGIYSGPPAEHFDVTVDLTRLG